MARIELGYNGRGKLCSYKRTTLLICSINISVALYVLHSLYTSLYIYSYNDSQNVFKYTIDQARKMEESIRIRRASEPLELIELTQQIKRDLNKDSTVSLPQPLKQKIMDGILERFRGLSADGNVSQHREAVETWRLEVLKELKQLTPDKNTFISTVSPKELGMVARALDSGWDDLSEEIGLWIPVEINNEEHDDKPEGASDIDDEVLAGKQLPGECNAELHTDYGGAAVRWGLTHPKESAYDCCQACIDQARHAQPGKMKCNIWVYCPLATGCYSPDIYEHKNMECWLKYADNPKVNFKDQYSESYRNSHPNVPLVVPWVSGVVKA